MRRLLLPAATCLLIMVGVTARAADSIAVVAAENVYGDIAQQIGGPEVTVTSILSNPDQDPHLFEVSPSAGRAVSAARIVVYNGAGYDQWMERLLRATRNPDRKALVVADLTGRKPGDNPHLWYDPSTMPALARALAAELGNADPAHRTDYRDRLAEFEQSLQPIEARIAALRKRFAGTPVTATEPVFGYMLAALGLQVRNERFQLAVMNDTEPSPSDVAAFEDDLKNHRVHLLVYNRQATGPVVERMIGIAEASQIPVVAVTETEPPGKNYQTWMISELDAVGRALAK